MRRFLLLGLLALFGPGCRKMPHEASSASPLPQVTLSSKPEPSSLKVSNNPEALEAVRQAYKNYHQDNGLSLYRTLRDQPTSLDGDEPGREVARRMVESGLLSAEEAPRALASSIDDYMPDDMVFQGAALLANAGKALWFDVETGTYPNRHDFLLLDLAAISEGEFVPEAVSEEAPPADSNDIPYLVRFVHRKQAYELEATNFGDYYDLDALLRAANQAVSDSGLSKRFYTLETGDQTAIVVYMESQALASAIVDGLLPPPAGAGASAEQGKAAEGEVLESLKEQTR